MEGDPPPPGNDAQPAAQPLMAPLIVIACALLGLLVFLRFAQPRRERIGDGDDFGA